MSVDAPDMTIALMDGRQLCRWDGNPKKANAHEAVTMHFHNFRVDLWRTSDGFAFVWAYPKGSIKESPSLREAIGRLLVELPAHKTTKLGRFPVRSGCIGLIADSQSATHVTDTDLEKAAASKSVTNIDLEGDLEWGNLALVSLPNGIYELSTETLSPAPVYEDNMVGEIHARLSVRRVDDLPK